ncbi:DUF2752 domain-containing protein [candidate division KSB1 bacterium]|nr:DUF2752 domain-containing protein [candidate division KSB1 bacterium]
MKIFLILFFGAGLLFIQQVNPINVEFLTCQFHSLTGHSCPTCGMSRSLYAAAHLNFVEAFRLHILGPILFIAIVGQLVKWMAEVVVQRDIILQMQPILKRAVFICLLSSGLIFWVIRLFREIMA